MIETPQAKVQFPKLGQYDYTHYIALEEREQRTTACSAPDERREPRLGANGSGIMPLGLPKPAFAG